MKDYKKLTGEQQKEYRRNIIRIVRDESRNGEVSVEDALHNFLSQEFKPEK